MTVMAQGDRPKVPLLLLVMFLGVPAMGALISAVMLVGGITQLPGAKADLKAFRADPSCTSDLAAPSRAGECQVRSGIAETVQPAISGGRSSAVRDNLVIRFPDGSRSYAQLPGQAGKDFVRAVYPGDPVRVQVFRGRPIRVEGRDVAATTSLLPEVAESGDRVMAWLGAGMLAALAVAMFFILRWLRRFAA